MIFAQNVRLVVNLHGKVASIYFTSAVNVIQLWTESKDKTHLQVYKLFSLHRHPKHRRLVWNTNCLHFQHFKKLNYLTPTRRKLKIFLSWMLELSNSSFWLLRSCLVVGPRKHCQWLVAEWQVGLIHALKVLWTDPVFDHKQLKISFWQNGNGAKTFELQKEKTMWLRVFPMIGIELQIF